MPTQGPNQALARRRRLIAFAAVSAIVATLATAASLATFSLLPPRLAMRHLSDGAAVTHAGIQLPGPRRPATLTGFESQAKRLNLIANLMTSPPVLDRVAGLIGIDPGQVSATTQVTEDVSRSFIEPDSERRASEIRIAHDPYKLEIQARTSLPVLDVYAQAPSVAAAEDLADAAVRAGNAYLRDLARSEGVAGPPPVTLTPLAAARGETLEPTARPLIALLTFLVVFLVCFGLLFGLAQLRRGWLRAGPNAAPGRADREPTPAPPPLARPAADDWPHTTRALPWMVAGFIAMLWLLPINAITVQASLPVDLKLDRLVLPVIVVTWLLSLAAGGPGAPRWRFTKLHAAVAAFVGVAFLSVVLNAPSLAGALEFSLAIKKLTLLAAFFSIFLLVASVVRPTETRSFMTLTLALAVTCALGVLWEYRFGTNLFYTWSGRLFPSFFQVTPLDTSGFDEIGRRAVAGPADLSLEVVGMLSMALPIALVRVMHSKRSRERILCGIAACVLLGAMVATYRKSALLAPLTVCLILAYFRRRELLRLAPLGVVVLLAIPALAPNALGSVLDQFAPNRLGVSTVSDRVSDYDAIRPDLLSHLAFGRGFGSYEHTTYRVLDNDLLMRVVETGLLGLAAYVLMLLLAIGAAVPVIRGRDPSRAPPALAIAAAAGAFLVLSALFDIMSFPHGPYILMILFGFLAVIVGEEEGRPRGRRRLPTELGVEGEQGIDLEIQRVLAPDALAGSSTH
jgi:hypothetical protein